MDALTNPFNPGAGSKPPQLAGRDQILSRARLALRRLKLGHPVRRPKRPPRIGIRKHGRPRPWTPSAIAHASG